MTHELEADSSNASLKTLWGILAVAATTMFAFLPDETVTNTQSMASTNAVIAETTTTPTMASRETNPDQLRAETNKLRREIARLQSEIQELRARENAD